jgi:hypothetical protein
MRTWRACVAVVAMAFGCGALAACGKPTPASVCSHAAEVSPKVDENACTAELVKLHEQDPSTYEEQVKCLLNAKNDATVIGCRAPLEQASRIAAQAEEQRRLAEETAKLREQANAAQARIDGLLSQLSSAKDDATRLALQKQLQEEQQRQQDALVAKRSGGTKPPCNCSPGDPLCSCP